MFLPTLLKAVKHNPNAQKFFANVRVAILFGCNTMTNLEPHGDHGEYLSPEVIKENYDKGGKYKEAMIGKPDEVNTLEFYRSRLAREYGPDDPKHYEYTRNRKDEKCEKKYDHCAVTYLDRILPDNGLFGGYTDPKTGKFVGYHDYNYPYKMKLLFPKAKIILGFSSASPAEERRVKILEATFNDTLRDVNAWIKDQPDLKGQVISNILFPLISDNTDEKSVRIQKAIVAALRKNWTVETYDRNFQEPRPGHIVHRPSGSVSSVFPELENDSILGATFPDITSKQYGPYAPPGGVFLDAYPELATP